MPGETTIFEINTQPDALVIAGNQAIVKATLKEIFNTWNQNYTWEVFEEVPANWGLIFFISLPVSGPNKTVYFEKSGFTKQLEFYERPTGYTDYQWVMYIIDRWVGESEIGENFILEFATVSGNGIQVYGIEGEAINIYSYTGVTVTRRLTAESVKSYDILNFLLRIYEDYDYTTPGYTGKKNLSELSLTPVIDDPDLYLEYDFHEQLAKEQNGHFTIFGQYDNYTIHSSLVTRHSILFAINFTNNEVIYYRSILTQTFYVLQAKISDFFQSKLNELGKSFYQYHFIDNKRFLTFAPATKYIDIYSPEKLYWLNKPTSAAYIYFKLYYANGTTDYAYFSNESYLYSNNIIELNVAFIAIPAIFKSIDGVDYCIYVQKPSSVEYDTVIDARANATETLITIVTKENAIYVFNAESTDADDGDLVLIPDGIAYEEPGRYLKNIFRYNEISKYDVYVKDISNNVISETRTFILDTKFQPFARYFLFKNKLNAYEVIRTTGKLSVAENIDKEFILLDKEINYTTDYKEEKQIEVQRGYVAELNSGFFKNKEWDRHFSEFLESEDCYMLKFGKAYPIVIEKGKYNYFNDENKPNSKPFIYRIANPDDELYTDFTFDADVPISGDFSFDFNEDFY